MEVCSALHLLLPKARLYGVAPHGHLDLKITPEKKVTMFDCRKLIAFFGVCVCVINSKHV